jgi:mono/diheme cytochrome c family protein
MTQPNSSQSNAALIPALLLFGGLTFILMALFAANPSQRPGVALQPTVEVTEEATEAPTLPPTPTEVTVVTVALDPARVSAGETTYQTVCAACHGFNARGIQGLGKTLVSSPFVDGLTDDELVAFLLVGREVSDPLNTTGVPMPAKGGNPGLTDDDMHNVVAYIRSLNAPAGTVAAAPTAVPETTGPTATPYVFVPLPLSSGDSADAPAEATSSLFGLTGEQLYVQNCAGCHGLDGEGLPYLAPSLSESELAADQDGVALLQFLSDAQPPVNPEAAFPHPYRGGYPELNDEQLLDVIAYLYTLIP